MSRTAAGTFLGYYYVNFSVGKPGRNAFRNLHFKTESRFYRARLCLGEKAVVETAAVAYSVKIPVKSYARSHYKVYYHAS